MHWHELPKHGGNLPWAEQHFGIPSKQWIDLSTGISPWSWPVPELAQNVYQQLPYNLLPLLESASKYYECPKSHLLALPGSQCAIERIPYLVPKDRVALPEWGYNSHAEAWHQAGHSITFYHNISELLQLCRNREITYATIINPNNPSNQKISIEEIQRIERTLFKRHQAPFQLIIDEAFMDAYSECSFIGQQHSENTLILRSIGKFFGLAGIRLGFAIGDPKRLKLLKSCFGEWSISGPSLAIGQQALADTEWINTQRVRLKSQSTEFESTIRSILNRCNQKSFIARGNLFHSIFGHADDLFEIFTSLGKRGVLTRFIQHRTNRQACLRLGLPGDHLNRTSNIVNELV